MSDKTKAEDLMDEDIDTVAGGDKDHKEWIPILTISEGIHKPSSDVAMEELTIAHEGLRRKQ